MLTSTEFFRRPLNTDEARKRRKGAIHAIHDMVDGYRIATENECHVSKGTSASETYARSSLDSKEVRVKGRWPKMHAFVTCVQPAAVPSILCNAHVSLYYGLSKKGKGQVARNRQWPEQKRKRYSHNLAILFYIMYPGHDKSWMHLY